MKPDVILPTEKFWNRPGAGQSYDLQFKDLIGWYTNETETQPLLDLTKDVRGKKVLDVGCGTGRHLSKFNRDNTLYGIDWSSEMLAVAQQVNPNANFKVASAESLPYDSNMFDVVYSIRVLQHLRNQEQAIREIIRVAKPGGKIIIINYNSWSLLNLYKHLRMSKFGKILNVPFKLILKDRSFFAPWGFSYDNYTSIPELKKIMARNGASIDTSWGLSSAMPWFLNNFFIGKILQKIVPPIFKLYLKVCLFFDRHFARIFLFKYFTDLVLISGQKK